MSLLELNRSDPFQAIEARLDGEDLEEFRAGLASLTTAAQMDRYLFEWQASLALAENPEWQAQVGAYFADDETTMPLQEWAATI